MAILTRCALRAARLRVRTPHTVSALANCCDDHSNILLYVTFWYPLGIWNRRDLTFVILILNAKGIPINTICSYLGSSAQTLDQCLHRTKAHFTLLLIKRACAPVPCHVTSAPFVNARDRIITWTMLWYRRAAIDGLNVNCITCTPLSCGSDMV